jgi:hypothetical protein
MDESLTSTTTGGEVITGFAPVGVDIFTPIATLFSSGGPIGGLLTIWGVLGVVSVLWSVYALLAYIATIVMLSLYVYASVRLQQLGAIEDQIYVDAEKLWSQKYRGIPASSRLQDMLTHVASDRPNDWKLAIIEADIILDELLKQRGYAGNSLGERLKSIAPSQLVSLQDAWEAHKVRNRIAHEGADFVLTHRVAEETIVRYRRVFAEFGVQ